MIDYIVILIILGIVAMAVRYIVREKKKGNVCIGCSDASGCSHSYCKKRENIL